MKEAATVKITLSLATCENVIAIGIETLWETIYALCIYILGNIDTHWSSKAQVSTSGLAAPEQELVAIFSV
jgi:hypothetical protein